jgi:lysophospholipase L1-like esterase
VVAYTYSRVAALNFNTTPPTVARSATGSVYAIADTTFTTPLTITMVVGGSTTTTISSDANGFFPDFTVNDRTSVVWKQASSSFTTVLTTSDPVPGPQGAAGTPGATGAQGPRGDLATWQTATFYPLNQVIANPSGDLVKVTTAHTSGETYDGTKFGWVNNNAANLTGLLPEASVPTRLTATELNATYVVPLGNRTGILGDSITNANELYTISGGYITTPGAGYFYQANMHLRNALTLTAEAGVSGERTEQILARVSEVLSVNSDIVVVPAGTNDVFFGRTSAQIITGLTDLYDALREGGVQLVAAPHIIPATTYTSGQRQIVQTVNQWITDYCRDEPKMVAVPWAAPLTDVATGLPATGMTYDGTHPTTTGAAFMGKVLADSLRPYVTGEAALTYSNTDETNALTNGLMTGDVSGFATGYSNVSTGSPVFTARKRARGDGIPGEWQEIDLTSGTVQLQCESGAAGTAWQVGDTVQAFLEVDTDSDFDAVTKLEVYLRGVVSGGGLVNQSAGLFDSYTSPRRPPVSQGVIATVPLLVTATMVKFQLRLQVAGAGVIRTARWTIRKVA